MYTVIVRIITLLLYS